MVEVWSLWVTGHALWSRSSILDDPGWLKMQHACNEIRRGERKSWGQARPEPLGWDDKRQQWRHFMVTISTCPSVAATGSTQLCRIEQCAALSWRDKGEGGREKRIVLTNKGDAALWYILMKGTSSQVFRSWGCPCSGDEVESKDLLYFLLSTCFYSHFLSHRNERPCPFFLPRRDH